MQWTTRTYRPLQGGSVSIQTSCRQDDQRVMFIQDGFASLKLKAAKGTVAVVQLQLLMQQLAPLMMRHHQAYCW